MTPLIMVSVGVVVPAYRPDVDRLVAYLDALSERLDPEALRVELDDPDPATVDRLTGVAEVNAVPYRRGKGAAVTAGFEALDTDVLAFVDADGSTPADSFAQVVAPTVEGRADLAVGSRRHPDATVTTHQSRLRRRMGDGFARLARTLLDVSLYDYQCGAKAITAEGWATVRSHLYEAGFAWDIELVAVAGALDLRVVEVPITWRDHPESTVAPVRTSLGMARGLLAAHHRARRLENHPLHRAVPTESSALVEHLERADSPEHDD